jgi:hypothetical protein
MKINEQIEVVLESINSEKKESKKLEKALFGIILFLQNKQNYTENRKVHPLPTFQNFVHYILIKNKYTSKIFSENKGILEYKLSESIILKKRINKKGYFYISTENIFPITYEQELAKEKQYKYDTAISFAGEEREIASEITKLLKEKFSITVFYDDEEKYELWGKDLFNSLYQIYSRDSRIGIMLWSKNYSLKIWTNHELKALKTKLLNENKDNLLIVKLDDTDLPIELENISYIIYSSETNLDTICEEINTKVWSEKEDNWYSLDEFYEHLKLEHYFDMLRDQFIIEIEASKESNETLINTIIFLIMSSEPLVRQELKSFYEFVIYRISSLSNLFDEDDTVTLSNINPNCKIRRKKVGNQIFTMNPEYWGEVINEFVDNFNAMFDNLEKRLDNESENTE